jgi:hypothetical protein
VETARGRHTQPVLRNQPAAAAPGSRRHHPQAQPSWLPADLLGVAFVSTGAPPVDLERRSVEIERDRWVSSNKRAKERGTGKGKGEHRGKKLDGRWVQRPSRATPSGMDDAWTRLASYGRWNQVRPYGSRRLSIEGIMARLHFPSAQTASKSCFFFENASKSC